MAAGVTAGTVEEDLAPDIKKIWGGGEERDGKEKRKLETETLRGTNGTEVWREDEKWIMMIGLQLRTIEPLAG